MIRKDDHKRVGGGCPQQRVVHSLPPEISIFRENRNGGGPRRLGWVPPDGRVRALTTRRTARDAANDRAGNYTRASRIPTLGRTAGSRGDPAPAVPNSPLTRTAACVGSRDQPAGGPHSPHTKLSPP